MANMFGKHAAGRKIEQKKIEQTVSADAAPAEEEKRTTLSLSLTVSDKKALKIMAAERVDTLLDDSQVTDKKGIFEYVLGGEKDFHLLNVRVFDKKIIRVVYRRQTEEAKGQGVSNCPLCAIGHDANAKRIYKETEMDADQVTAWSKGGATDEVNCQMLCKTHNRAKGNR